LVLLYDVNSGGLLALFDADELTRVRTAAVTALAGMAMVDAPPQRLGLIGTGFEAVGICACSPACGPLTDVTVFQSQRPTPDPLRRGDAA